MDPLNISTINLKSLEGCSLKIGSYPTFNYNATGGGGVAEVHPTKQNNISKVSFKPDKFFIPPLNYQTTKFLSLPLPAGLKIQMYMEKLEGTIDRNTGEILLRFESRFIFSIFSQTWFPDLIVKTSLKTGNVQGELHKEEGLVLQKDGKATLVGIAIVPLTGNKILDIFLGLPNEALAVLQCKIT